MTERGRATSWYHERVELRLTVHAASDPTPPAHVPEPETFAVRMARWIRRRLGRPEPPDERAAAPWLDGLPGMQRARSARIASIEGVLEVTVELADLPTPDELRAWLDTCVLQR